MDVIQRQLENTGITLHGARNLRMRRPALSATQSSRGIGLFENLGTATFKGEVKVSRSSASSSRKGKEQKTVLFSDDEESEDELLLSDNLTVSSTGTTPKSKAKPKAKPSLKSMEPEYSADGLRYHEDYRPKKLPNFKKKSKQSHSESPLAAEPSSQSSSSAIKTNSEPSTVGPLSSLSKTRLGPGPRPAYISGKAGNTEKTGLVASTTDFGSTGVLSKVDKVSPVLSTSIKGQETPLAIAKRRRAQPHPSVRLNDSPAGTETPRLTVRRKPQAFPMKTNKLRDNLQSSPTISKSKTKKRTAQPFPLSIPGAASGSKSRVIMSPTQDDDDSDKENRDKGDDDDDDDDLLMNSTDRILLRGGLKPFPMKLSSLQSFTGTSTSSKSSIEKYVNELHSPARMKLTTGSVGGS